MIQPHGRLSNQYWMMPALIIIQGCASVGGGGGESYFLNPAHNWIHDCIRDWHLGLEPEVGSSLEYEYSVTQLPPGDYIYVKWWEDGPGFAILAMPESQSGVETSSWRQKVQVLFFPFSPIFGARRSDCCPFSPLLSNRAQTDKLY